jgi:hypothetical protein
MNLIETIYAAIKAEHGATEWPEYALPGGKVVVSPCAQQAFVFTDGRYPTLDDGFHLNDRIAETEDVLWGGAVFEFTDPPEVVVARAGDSVRFPPGRPYSVSGKCVSRVRMDQPWDTTQKHFVQRPVGAAPQP